MTPGTYRMLFVSPKSGATRFTVTVPASGAAQTVAVGDTTNLAAAAAGASVISATAGSLNAEALIDGTEATNWGGVTAENVDVSRPTVAVDLAGATSIIDRVQVSAMLVPAPGQRQRPVPLAADPDSGSRFTALRTLRHRRLHDLVQRRQRASGSGSTPRPPTRFPAVRPRPVAPDLTLRSFALPSPVQAAAVRLVTLENQCTGFAGYAGEQDADPTHDTDCATASDRGTIVHAAELQVFGAPQ